MAFVSVTRLRVRSYFYLPQFIWWANKSARQAEVSPGFLGGILMRNARNVFWTLTVWNEEASMNAYRIAGAHRSVMPKLLSWCDEAAVAHWQQDSAELPSWQEAHRHLVQEGRLSKVNHPSPRQSSLSQILPPESTRAMRMLARAAKS